MGQPSPPGRRLRAEQGEPPSLVEAGELRPLALWNASEDAAQQARGRSPLPAGIQSQVVTPHHAVTTARTSQPTPSASSGPQG
jgi:hypothetical protein